MSNRFDLRRRSTGLALGDPVTEAQPADALAFVRGYQGTSRFILSLQDWLFERGTISRRQVAAVLQIRAQEGGDE